MEKLKKTLDKWGKTGYNINCCEIIEYAAVLEQADRHV